MTQNFGNDGAPFSVTKLRTLENADDGEFVVSGCAVSPGTGSFDVDVASGEVVVSDSLVSVSAATVSLSTSGAEDRFDLITVDSTDTISATEGSPASTSGQPNAPDIPADEVVLAVVHVRGGSSEVLAGDILNEYKTFGPSTVIADDGVVAGVDLSDHSARHSDGGGDELDAADLAGADGTDGDVLTSDGSAAAWESVPQPLYGDGADGSITRSSSANENGSVRAEDYTVQSGVTMTVSNGVLVVTARDFIQIGGTITAAGQGGSGGSGGGSGGSGSSGTDGSFSPIGTGGAGGSGAAPALGGGGGGDGDQRQFPVRDALRTYGSPGLEAMLDTQTPAIGAGGGGGGGGSGGGDVDGSNGSSPGGGGGGGEDSAASPGSGGAGGAGGGLIALIAPSVTLASTATLDVSGADGADGNADLGGGGGGGSGGCLFIVTGAFTNNGATINFGGGAGGTGDSAGGQTAGDGASGDAGAQIRITPL